jgi:hypothetical protein
MKEAYLCFSHFARNWDDVTHSYVTECLLACTGIICKPNQYGVDLVVPFHHGAVYSEANIDAICIQVKNRFSNYSEMDIAQKLKASYSRIFGNRSSNRTILVSMGLGRDREDVIWSPGHRLLSLQGLGPGVYRILDQFEGLQAVLGDLADHAIDLPSKQESAADAQLVRRMYRRQYRHD